MLLRIKTLLNFGPWKIKCQSFMRPHVLMNLSLVGLSGVVQCAESNQISIFRAHPCWKEKKRSSWSSAPSRDAGLFGASVLEQYCSIWVPYWHRCILYLFLSLDSREEFCSFFAESGLCPFEEECRYLTAKNTDLRGSLSSRCSLCVHSVA